MRADVVCLTILACGMPLVLLAQTPDTSTVQGQVEDPNHQAISGATVTVHNLLTGFTRTVKTNDRGRFSFAGLPVAGNYSLSTDKAGFAETRLYGITLAAGRIANFSLQLNIANSQTRVIVTGTVGKLQIGAPQLGKI